MHACPLSIHGFINLNSSQRKTLQRVFGEHFGIAGSVFKEIEARGVFKAKWEDHIRSFETIILSYKD
jgi:hypothetical protein